MRIYKRKTYPRSITGFRICKKCGVLKHVDKFYTKKEVPTGLQPCCKECTNSWHKTYFRKCIYGIDYPDFKNMVAKQDNKCAICGLSETKVERTSGKPLPLSVDHDHKTGRIRGLLCSKCNKAIGILNEDIKLLNNAIVYLKNPYSY